MAQLRNVSGTDLVVPWLGHRLVRSDEVVDVTVDDALSYLVQPATWAPVDADAEEILAVEQERVSEDRKARFDEAVGRNDVETAIAVLAEAGPSPEYLEQARTVLTAAAAGAVERELVEPTPSADQAAVEVKGPDPDEHPDPEPQDDGDQPPADVDNQLVVDDSDDDVVDKRHGAEEV